MFYIIYIYIYIYIYICLSAFMPMRMSWCERNMSDQSSQSNWQLAAENSQNSQTVRLTVFSVLDLHTTHSRQLLKYGTAWKWWNFVYNIKPVCCELKVSSKRFSNLFKCEKFLHRGSETSA